MPSDEFHIKLATLDTRLTIFENKIDELAKNMMHVSDEMSEIRGSYKSPLSVILLGAILTLIGVIYTNILADTKSNTIAIDMNQDNNRKELAGIYSQLAILDKRISVAQEHIDDKLKYRK